MIAKVSLPSFLVVGASFAASSHVYPPTALLIAPDWAKAPELQRHDAARIAATPSPLFIAFLLMISFWSRGFNGTPERLREAFYPHRWRATDRLWPTQSE